MSIRAGLTSENSSARAEGYTTPQPPPTQPSPPVSVYHSQAEGQVGLLARHMILILIKEKSNHYIKLLITPLEYPLSKFNYQRIGFPSLFH